VVDGKRCAAHLDREGAAAEPGLPAGACTCARAEGGGGRGSETVSADAGTQAHTANVPAAGKRARTQ
jgi:hypothetical protein